MDDFNEHEPLLENSASWDSLQAPSPPDHLREALRARTSSAVRFRARRQRWLRRGSLTLAYSLGIATAVLWPRAQPEPSAVAGVTPGTPAVVPADSGELTEALLDDPEQFALYLRKVTPEQQYRALKVAGDRCLYDEGDINRALAYYRQLLASAPPKMVRSLDVTDTWLLRSLKKDRAKEMSYENGDA